LLPFEIVDDKKQEIDRARFFERTNIMKRVTDRQTDRQTQTLKWVKKRKHYSNLHSRKIITKKAVKKNKHYFKIKFFLLKGKIK
jgi:hypothetical protein